MSLENVYPIDAVGEDVILRVGGRIDVTGLLPGEATAPCRIRIVSDRAKALVGGGAPVATVVTIDGESIQPETHDLELIVSVANVDVFRRGDSDASGEVELTDAIALFGCLFLGLRCPPCDDSADSNDDGGLDLSDGIFVLQWLFSGGPPPSAPGPAECGPDPTSDDLGPCDYESCS